MVLKSRGYHCKSSLNTHNITHSMYEPKHKISFDKIIMWIFCIIQRETTFDKISTSANSCYSVVG